MKKRWDRSLKGDALQTYLALGGTFAPGDKVKLKKCPNDGHSFHTDSHYTKKAMEVANWDGSAAVFKVRIKPHQPVGASLAWAGYPYCLCGVVAWRRLRHE